MSIIIETPMRKVENLPGVIYDPTKKQVNFAEDHNSLVDAIEEVALKAGTGGGGGLGTIFVTSRIGGVSWSKNQTFYFGNNANNTDTSASLYRAYIPKACTLKSVVIYSQCNTLGTSENINISVFKNGNSDTSIATDYKMDSAYNVKVVENLNIAFNAGDYFFIKMMTPNWLTAPASGMLSFTLYFE